jgi:hypothetical protein
MIFCSTQPDTTTLPLVVGPACVGLCELPNKFVCRGSDGFPAYVARPAGNNLKAALALHFGTTISAAFGRTIYATPAMATGLTAGRWMLAELLA